VARVLSAKVSLPVVLVNGLSSKERLLSSNTSARLPLPRLPQHLHQRLREALRQPLKPPKKLLVRQALLLLKS
jgi:hypothetical protein